MQIKDPGRLESLLSCKEASIFADSSVWSQEELTINPFLRTKEAALQEFTGKSDPVEVLAALRKAKDSF